MKKINVLTKIVIAGGFSILLLQGCEKNIDAAKPAASEQVAAGEVSSELNINEFINPSGVVGNYTVRDAKTIYIGQANDNGSNVLIHLDYIDVTKKIDLSENKKSLTSDYGPSTTNTQGWKYIISYDVKTKAIVLKPNDVMLAGIVPGSFEQLLAKYDTKAKKWVFVTRYTGLNDNGNESEVSETYWKN